MYIDLHRIERKTAAKTIRIRVKSPHNRLLISDKKLQNVEPI